MVKWLKLQLSINPLNPFIHIPTIKMETIKMTVHLICPVCFYDLAEWGAYHGIDIDSETCDLVGWFGNDLHIYRIRSGGDKCDYDAHMYLVNAR